MAVSQINLLTTFAEKIVRINLEFNFYIKILDPTFFPGRAAEIVLRKVDKSETVLGVIGVLHPEVLSKFDLNLPCCAMEINIEPFV